MGQDIVQHCKTCKECLKFNHKKTRKEPLHPLPVISTPWERIAIDIVGKLPRTARGHSYILTLMDFGTRYMEAIPLKRVDAHTTCEALLEVFARFGVPKEVLSDNGSNFIATVTETLMKKLKCYHIKASPFHPQTNGMLERSHQVLKKTLDKLGCTKKNWDDYLAPTLMALRTAPHAALGVTPFELMFGREARTPIAALREEMEGEQKTPRSVVEYMQDLYQRMEESQKLVEREDSKAKEKSKTYYDKRKKSDPLKEGEFVLMMTPKGEESLTCQWQGPYKILRRLGDTTYLVDAPYKNGKRGRKCHRNLLKRYFLQVMSTAVMLAAEGDNIAEFPHFKPEETDKERKWKEANLDGDLTEEQKKELLKTLIEFDDVFKNTPGEAKVEPFTIPTGEAKPISTYPRGLSPKWKQKILEEVQALQSTGIIVPSRSPWASPIVPVPKPQGGVRMCIDYKPLNKVTDTDVYPLPRVEQLLEEVTQSRYITTLDLTKGYYQFPMHPEHQQKTAFVTPQGKWEFTRMPFGLKGAPAKFQRTMDQLFQEYSQLCAYIDDVAIHSQTWEQHIQDIRKALTLLREKGLTAKLGKCKFAGKYVQFLGHVVGGRTDQTPRSKGESYSRVSKADNQKADHEIPRCNRILQKIHKGLLYNSSLSNKPNKKEGA